MSGILRLESLTKGNTLKQGDKTPLKYRLFDADGEKLNIAGKSAQVRLVYPDFLTIGYEKAGLTVAQDDTVTFTIDGVIPSRIYYVEIIVDDKFVFPSRSDEAKFTVDKSSLGTEANIIEIVGVDQIVNKVLGKVDADISQVITDITTTNQDIQQAEAERIQAEQERTEKFEGYEQEIGGVADEVEDSRLGKPTLGAKLREIDNELISLTGGTRKLLFAEGYRPSAGSEKVNYWLIFNPVLSKGVRYALEFIPNETFTHDGIQIGTTGSMSSMVDTVVGKVDFVAGKPYWVEEYIPSQENLGYVRIIGNALKIDRINVYIYSQEEGEINKTKEVANEANVTSVEAINMSKDLEVRLFGQEYKSYLRSATRPSSSESLNYLYINNPMLSSELTYALEFIPNATFVQSEIQMGTRGASSTMVDTLATDIDFKAGQSFWVENYTPSQDDLSYVRIIGNAEKIEELKIYTYLNETGALDELEKSVKNVDSINEHHISHKINENISGLRYLKNHVDESLSSLAQVQVSDGITKNMTLPSIGKREKYLLRVGLHYGSEQFTPSETEIFFDGQSRTDFSDVRFFDNNGKMLKASLGKPYNLDLLEDNNLDKMLKHTSDGKMVGYEERNGIIMSDDSGATWNPIPGTANVTENASSVYKRTSMYPVFVDSDDNIFAYAGGLLYKLYASDNYSTKKQVLDFSWDNNGTTIYPDIQDQGMDESLNGDLVVGACYNEQYHTNIYSSKDGGETFQLSWYDHFGEHQHVHHVHADRFTNRIYVGIDDGGRTLIGARIIYTEDGGDSWVNVTDRHEGIRGRDFYPTYFGENYHLGGGESYYNGGGVIYKADNEDRNWKIPVKGISGVRKIVDFGSDDLIVAGTTQTNGVSVNQILVSDDRGDNWSAIYSKQTPLQGSSGNGFRQGYDAFTPYGETEECVVYTRDWGQVKSVRLYKGGNHYYREAYIELENIEDEPIDLTVKTGYMMAYPYKVLNGRKHDGLVYEVPLNEGLGGYVSDSLGNVVKISGNDYEWERDEEPVRYGEYGEYNQPLIPSSGIKLGEGTTINFGKVPQLDFNKGYTVTFWINPKNRWYDTIEYSSLNTKITGLFEVGNITFVNRGREFGYVDKVIDSDEYLSLGHSLMNMSINSLGFNDQYFMVVISVDDEGKVYTYINGGNVRTIEPTLKYNPMSLENLSTEDFIIGSEKLPSAGYLSDIKIYNRVIEADEILELYKGW